MSQRIYRKLYTLVVEHGFYDSGFSSDFDFIPLSGTEKTLKANHLLLHKQAYGFDLVYRTDEGGLDPFVPVDQSVKLRFGIASKEELVHTITDFPSKSNSSDIYYCSGKYDTSTLSVSAIPSRHISFEETFISSESQITLRLVDDLDNTVFEETKVGLQDDTDPTKYHFSFSCQPGDNIIHGKYAKKLLVEGVLLEEEDLFIYNKIQFSDLLGVLELELDNAIVYDSNLPYEAAIGFDSLATVWTYHIELSRNFTNGNFGITDTSGTHSFSEISSLTDYLEGETVVFQSTGAIEKTENPNKDFDLVITSDDRDLTISGLPNPEPNNTNSTIYLKI